jgi:hypothetical protein
LTGVPDAWLGGDMPALPWCRRWEYVEEATRPIVEELSYAVRAYIGEAAFRPGAEGVDWAMAKLRNVMFTSPTSIAPSTIVAELLAILDELALWQRQPVDRWNSLTQVARRLRALGKEIRFRDGDNPTLSQVAESRLIEKCWNAWYRDLAKQYPELNAAQLRRDCESAVAGSTISAGHVEEWSRIVRRVGELLSLRHWRTTLLGSAACGHNSDEEIAALPSLVTAVELFLKPWFEGSSRWPHISL